MPVSPEQIRHIATLARLNLSHAAITQLTSEIAPIITYVDNLQRVDVTAARDKESEKLVKDAGREDIAGPSLFATEALQNAPRREGDFFLVPRVIS